MELAELLMRQKQAILDGDEEAAVELAQEAIAGGVDLACCIDEGFAAGIREVGRLWEEGEYFLPELVQGADAMKAAMAIIRPELLKTSGHGAPDAKPVKVVLGTVAGDIHDIGKTLVGTILEANGVHVCDLGYDVPAAAFVDRAAEEGADIIGLSALLTTTMPVHTHVIELLEERGLRQSMAVMVGGAPVTRSYADQIGADGYAPNAVAAVAEVHRLAAARL